MRNNKNDSGIEATIASILMILCAIGLLILAILHYVR